MAPLPTDRDIDSMIRNVGSPEAAKAYAERVAKRAGPLQTYYVVAAYMIAARLKGGAK